MAATEVQSRSAVVLSKAKEYKATGNALMTQENWKGALTQYHFALLQLKSLSMGQGSMAEFGASVLGYTQSTEEEVAETRTLTIQCKTNMALVHSKLGNTLRVIQTCNEALELDPDCVKACYRRACAYMEKSKWRNLEKAARDLKHAHTLAPQDKAIVRAMHQVAALRKQANQKQGSELAGMFDR
mmetsp:Transcript_24898/g.62521  ORF Transcript_24898/g.62521 Transcript_24898/m.62521 type:complete len:185 (+) Transcript_24898:109-663(+)|eukprot:CAMPEP_0177653074 /NCGR_PEP_ID=MMETSP0447-20121125/13515_1 /TAXON_ID=0 /ORGANISM="Stygamoeba regulata, Strain BSH-02190019" /LENGTH=184 /DNA_ID=CAMNT_0019156453 /DNA_START=109 /DNA_END=663 /DNA_ORIENTATION=-